MKAKKFIISSVCITLFGLILLAGVNFVIDPLFQYHTPWFGLDAVIDNERYQNAGIAKNFDFDNVIIGSSMSENFKVSEFENTFSGKTVKLTLAGSHAPEYNEILNILSNRIDAPKRIFINIDPYYLRSSATEFKHEMPEYLYDNNYLNDVNYLLNFSILNDFAFHTIKQNLKGDIPDYNEAFVWDDGTECGKFKFVDFDVDGIPELIEDIITGEAGENLCKENIDVITAYIEKMPDTEFYIFYSPFSILYWHTSNNGKKTDTLKQFYTISAENLVSYNNVNLFLWNDNEMLDVISDLDNYRDTSHYSKEINSLILQKMSKGDCKLSEENFKEEIDIFFNYIKNFDYNALFTDLLNE